MNGEAGAVTDQRATVAGIITEDQARAMLTWLAYNEPATFDAARFAAL